MIIFNVTKDKVSIKQDDTLNRGEYNVTKCKFLFSKEYDGLVKEAIFFIEEKNIGILLDENDECNIPQEAFKFRGNIEIGLYAYYTNNNKLEKRYSPNKTTKVISDGSYTSEIDNTEEITPTDKEQMNSIIKKNVEEIKRLSTNKVDKVDGYNLSENNFSNIYKKKLDGIEQNAQVNKIEKIFINDDEMPIVEKKINITIPTKLTDLKNDNHFVNDKNYVHTDNNFTHTEKEKLKKLNNYDDSSLNEKIVENSNSILENKKDIQNLKETSEKNTSNINKFNKNLQNYSLVTETGYKLDLSIDSSTYIMTLKLLDKNENVLSTGKIDLPIESMIINVSYDSNVKRLTFSLQNGNIINVPLNDLISGLVTEKNLEETLKEYALKKDIPKNLSELKNDSNYVKNTDYATKTVAGVIKGTGAFCFIVDSEGQPKLNILDYDQYNKYSFNNFISKGTLENVIEGKKLETKNNKVVSVSKNSTDEQYPSAKCTYEIKKDLEKLKDEILEIGEVSDSYIHVEDSTMGEMQELSVEGVCKQETTKGYQLINFDNLKVYNATYTFMEDTLKITSEEKSYASAYIIITDLVKANPNKILRMFYENIDLSEYTSSNSTLCQITTQYNDGTAIKYLEFLNKDGRTNYYAIPSDVSNISNVRLSFYSNNSNKIDSGTVIIKKPMISFDKNATYEPYTGGQPSPSPDYPQEIKTITDSLSVTSCNKNLFDKNDENMFLKDLVPDNAGLILSGITNLSAQNFIRTAILKCKPNTTYTISKLASRTFYIYDSEKLPSINYRMRTILNNGTDKSKYTFTTSQFAKYIVIKFFNTWANEIYSYDEIVSSIQIEECSTQTSFVEHIQSQITANLLDEEFIGKINDIYKDTLSVDLQDDGKHHLMLNKMVGKRILNSGDMSSRIVLNTGDIMYRTMKFRDISINKVFIILCNRYVGIEQPAKRKDGNIYWNSLNRTIDIIDNRAGITTIDEFKTWLSTHNLEVYYVLENPYKVDLGIVDMPFSYDEVTNIFTDSELLPKINVKYYKNFISTIRNLKVNNDNLKNELVSINNRLAVLENANVSAVNDEVTEESEVTSNE